MATKVTRDQQDPTEAARRVPGGEAERPREIPPRGWWQVVKRAWKEAKTDQVPLLAAGVAFFSFLALFPALIAAVLAYGLFADPAQVRDHLDELAGALPSSARDLLLRQAESITSAPQQALGIGVVVALLAALWSASGGVGNLMSAVNITYDEEESRNFIVRKLLALLLTVGGIVFVLLAIGMLAVAPVVIDTLAVAEPIRWLLEAARWVIVLLAVTLGLAIVYRLAPSRDDPQMRWVSVGAVVATVVWLIASIGFSLYVDNFGSYGETYGSLAGVAVLMLWLWITAYVVLLGAEINAESEQQTVRDTTVGEERPLGQRDAVKADTTPSPHAPASADDKRR